MPIHPSRFSSRQRASRRPNILIKTAGLAVVLAAAVALILGVRVGLSLLGSLENIPNQKPYPIDTKSKERTNLLLVLMTGSEPKSLALVSLSGGDAAKYIPIDPTIAVSVPGDRGSYTLSGVWSLGNLDGGQGMNDLRDSISQLLALPIDGYLAIPEESQPQWAKIWGATPQEVEKTLAGVGFWQKLLDLSSLPKIYGSYQMRDLVSLAFQARDSGQVKEFSLNAYLSPGSLAGEEVQNLNSTSFDQNLAPEFFESSISRARPKVSIVNSSGITGAGTLLARYVRNLGGEVISVTSGREVKDSQVLDHTGGGSLAERVAPLITGLVSVDKENRRADIEIIIGQSAQGRF